MALHTGLDRLAAEGFQRLRGARVGLLAHGASVDKNLNHILNLALNNGINVVKLFGPEHGFFGELQDMEAVSEGISDRYKLPVISLYGHDEESLRLPPHHLDGIDVLVCDLQDIGSRYYTFSYTIAFAMEACAHRGVKCVVLDRPNPISCGVFEGNGVKAPFRSFVGGFSLPNRHGFTIGELATFFQTTMDKPCDLDVVWMEGYDKYAYLDAYSRPFILPSPNMPTLDTALVYPGMCLIEGTNMSEGRGTTKPFEMIGAPYISDAEDFVAKVSQHYCEGAILRPCYFRPMFQKHQGQRCAGLFIHVVDRQRFRPVRFALSVLEAALSYDGFDWRRERYEFVSDRLAIDLLFGDDQPRKMLERHEPVAKIASLFEDAEVSFAGMRNDFSHSAYGR